MELCVCVRAHVRVCTIYVRFLLSGFIQSISLLDCCDNNVEYLQGLGATVKWDDSR